MPPECGLSSGKPVFFKKSQIFPISAPEAMQTVLTIAGFDPSSGAGVTADLMVFAAHRLFGTACITGLTVQSTVGVRSSHPTAASLVRETLDCLHADLPPAGIKIGMLSSSDNIRVICDYLEQLRQIHENDNRVVVVCDPVLRASSGRELIDPSGIALLRERLLPLVDWITPNLDELAILSGESVGRRDDLPNACRELQEQSAGEWSNKHLGIIATGGHMNPPDDLLLTPGGEEYWLEGERVETLSTHGTGCAFSSAFLGRLVLGDSPVEAARAAKAYVSEALRTAVARGKGNGPLNLLWPLLESGK
jgi:hydroxymethylpyrimidine/phosphomethylpyrimidine kinase